MKNKDQLKIIAEELSNYITQKKKEQEHLETSIEAISEQLK